MFQKSVWLTAAALAIVGGGLAAETLPFKPGPLTAESVNAAAAAAGFKIRAVTADIPTAAHSGFRFVPFDYDDPRLAALREKYSLEKLVAEAPDEWAAQLRLKEWIYERIPGGNPRSSPASAQEILELAAKGERLTTPPRAPASGISYPSMMRMPVQYGIRTTPAAAGCTSAIRRTCLCLPVAWRTRIGPWES